MKYDCSQLPIFANIDSASIEALLSCTGARTAKYARGELIFLENDDIRSIGVVLSGSVCMIKEDRDGNRTLLVTIKERELFGESFACRIDCGSEVSFEAASPCEVMFLPFNRVLHTCSLACAFHHRLIENMVQIIAGKNQRLMEKIEIVSQKTLRGKLKLFLELESARRGSRSFELDMNRSELAEYLCADRSAMTRELGAMREEGLIAFERNSFSLPESE